MEHARNRRRASFFEACLKADASEPMVACEGAVGLGKTTAVTAYLLRRARDEKLRHLIIVAPYTNILKQSAERLREALVLKGELPEEVVMEHHHRADFSSREDRELAALWQAPIILTTAVSFFETLAACDPATLRKFHSVPGSAIFLDEAHATLPATLWPQNWRWLRELADDWGCRFVFASGSLVRFWEHPDIVDKPVRLPELTPAALARDVRVAERKRVHYLSPRVSASGDTVLRVEDLMKEVGNALGPRLVILNTVQNAAVVAKGLQEAHLDVLHMSTALAPRDRSRILQRVTERLEAGSSDWTLVATSCVEAGVDLSFRTAFRERFSVASLIQTGGRVNRNGEYDRSGGGSVYDFALTGKHVTQHPCAQVSAEVLLEYMSKRKLDDPNPASLVTEAMCEEVSRTGGLGHDSLIKAEGQHDYPGVAEHGRVITADTRLVVVDERLRNALCKRAHVDFRELLQGSVQLWARKISALGLEPLPGRSDIYAWNNVYDPDFLGVMAGILNTLSFVQKGGGVI